MSALAVVLIVLLAVPVLAVLFAIAYYVYTVRSLLRAEGVKDLLDKVLPFKVTR